MIPDILLHAIQLTATAFAWSLALYAAYKHARAKQNSQDQE